MLEERVSHRPTRNPVPVSAHPMRDIIVYEVGTALICALLVSLFAVAEQHAFLAEEVAHALSFTAIFGAAGLVGRRVVQIWSRRACWSVRS